MQIVIDISKDIYNDIVYHNLSLSKADELCRAVVNGTPLPKGHGRFKDIDVFIAKVQADRQHAIYTRSWTADDVLDALSGSYISTIIEADGGGEDDT